MPSSMPAHYDRSHYDRSHYDRSHYDRSPHRQRKPMAWSKHKAHNCLAVFDCDLSSRPVLEGYVLDG